MGWNDGKYQVYIMMKRNGIPLALLLVILVMAVLAAPVAAGLTITDGVKIISPYGATSPVITITGSNITAGGTITINVSSLNAYVDSAPITDLNVEIATDAAAATWSGVVDGDGINLTLTSTGGNTTAGESVTVTFTGAVNPWVADSGGNKTLPLEVTRTDTDETATISFVIDTGGLTITDGATITLPYGATSPVITIAESDFPQDGTITIDASPLSPYLYYSPITNNNVVITSDAVDARWEYTVLDGTLTLTSTTNDTVVGESVTVTFTGAGGNHWSLPPPGGEVLLPLTVTRTDTSQTATLNIAMNPVTPDPGGLIVTNESTITTLDGATSPLITIDGAEIPGGGTIIIEVPYLFTLVNSGTFTDENVEVTSDAHDATWNGTVSAVSGVDYSDFITLTSTGGNTTAGEKITVTFTGAHGNPWISPSGEQTFPLTVARTDTSQTASINFTINTVPPPGYTVIANFSASPTSDIAPLVVTFTDTSLGHPTSWSWDFGDGGTSASCNPSHTYTDVGTYTVSLNATNEYGSDTKTQWNYIHVLNWGITVANTAIEGLTINHCMGSQTITVDTSKLQAALIPNNSVLEIQPTGSGFNTITLYAMNGVGFTRNSNLITGNPTGVHLVSEEIAPSTGFSSETGTNASFNYSIDLASYPCNAKLSTKIWEGVITETDNKFRRIVDGNNGSVVGTAYTAKITKTNFPSGARVKLHMSVNSSWNTYPHLPGAPGMMFIWRIADDEKSGQIFPTTYLYTAPVNNLNYYEADSPSGLSMFGLSSLTGNNNPFQIVAFVAAAVIAPAAHNPGSPAVVQTMLAPEINQTTLPDPGTTAKIYSNADGVITQATKLLSTDGLASFTIGKGIIAKNSSGMPLTSISIRRIPAGELPAGLPGGAWSFAGMAYDIQPDGATFSPSASLSFTVPQAQWSKEFAVQQYDSATGTWQVLPGSYIPETGMITVQVSHVCHFALFAKSTEIEKAATTEPTILVASKSPVQTNVEMYSWIISSVVQNPVIIVIVLAALAAVAYFGWWKRRL